MICHQQSPATSSLQVLAFSQVWEVICSAWHSQTPGITQTFLDNTVCLSVEDYGLFCCFGSILQHGHSFRLFRRSDDPFLSLLSDLSALDSLPQDHLEGRRGTTATVLQQLIAEANRCILRCCGCQHVSPHINPYQELYLTAITDWKHLYFYINLFLLPVPCRSCDLLRSYYDLTMILHLPSKCLGAGSDRRRWCRRDLGTGYGFRPWGHSVGWKVLGVPVVGSCCAIVPYLVGSQQRGRLL